MHHEVLSSHKRKYKDDCRDSERLNELLFTSQLGQGNDDRRDGKRGADEPNRGLTL